MKIINKFLSRFRKKDKPEDLLQISRIIGPLIDKIAIDIFSSNKDILLKEQITYIVPAVWGAKKDGELTSNQKEIHKQIIPIIEDVFEKLALKKISPPQKFAIGYIIRGLIISKITYMILMLKNKINYTTNPTPKINDDKNIIGHRNIFPDEE